MKHDIDWGTFLDVPERFADVLNGLGCAGVQVVKVDDLQDVDTKIRPFRTPKFVRRFSKNKSWKRTKYRDMARKVAMGVNYVIIGIENQETIDYSLPLRNMLYDVAEYEKQAVKIRKFVRKNPVGLEPGEYLYGFRKDSKLFPVSTYILYCGEEEWTGPGSLHDMLDFTDIPESLRETIPDYKINLINVREIKDTSIFKTDVRHVIDFIRYVSDKKKLKELVESEPYFQNMEEDAYDVVVNYANINEVVNLKAEEGEVEMGKRNLCKGLQDWLEEEKTEGLINGIIKTARRYHASDEDIIQQIMEALGTDEHSAREYLSKAV